MMQKSLAAKLRLLRAQRGLTVKDAAGQLGIDRHTLRRIELGTQEAQYPTLAKIAEGYEVPVEELLEENGPLADATQESGQPETAPPPAEPPVFPQTAGALKASVDVIKRLKRQHESTLEKIRQGQLDYNTVLLMSVVNKGVRAGMNESGCLDFAKAVVAGREFAEPEAAPLCHALLRELANLESLTAEARTTAAMRSSDIREEIEKDAWQWMSGAGSLVSESVVSSDRAG
jgi:transcriptional regulator with XRE-family HTH domain